MWEIARDAKNTRDIVDAYAAAHNKFFWVEDDIYDYDKGTEEHRKACVTADSWCKLMDYLEEKVLTAAENEGLLLPKSDRYGIVKRLETFMKKYGYRDGNGWWVKDQLFSET